MALRVDRPQVTGIPESIFLAMEDLNNLPNEWEESWLASLKDDQANDEWLLRLLDQDGRRESATLYGHHANQDKIESVCASLMGLRRKWGK